MPDPTEPLIAGIELGGTKSLALAARGGRIVKSVKVPTTTPDQTLPSLRQALIDWQGELGVYQAMGVASFGPVGLDRQRPDFGFITDTPKAGWSHCELLEALKPRPDVPVGFDTDVAGAALAEYTWGAARGASVVVYLTVGTGLGGGVLVDGQPVHGRVHPEIGHIRVRRAPGDDFPGACPFHGDCIEGLVSGPAIARRTGLPAESLSDDHSVWARVCEELAELAAGLILTLSPDRILIGGGVGMGKPFLFPAIRRETGLRLNGYVAGLDEAALRAMIQQPGLGDDAGPLGAIALGLRAMRNQTGG